MQLRKKITTKLLPGFLILMALLFAACGGSGANQSNGSQKAPQSQQVFVDAAPVVGISDIATFDPGLSTDAPSISAIDMVFTGLVELDRNLQVQPQLAHDWSVSPDGLTWTFHLRPNLHFSDGTPLTSADVAYSIDRALQPATKSVVGPAYLALIKDSDLLNTGKIKTIIGDSVLTPDANTVVIIIKKKATYFLDALTYSCSYVLEKSLVTKYGTSFTDHLTEGGGDGPFKVSSYIHGKEIDFVPNPSYYGPIPQLQKVIFPFYKQVDTAFRAYQVGQVDTAVVPTANLSQAKALPNNQLHQVPQLWINYYSMNYLVKPFDNIQIRQAFELAINKDLITQTVWKNTLIPTNHIVPKGMPGYDSSLTGPDGVTGTAGDPTKAKALLQQGMTAEGYTSVSQFPPITLAYPTGSTDLDNEISAVIQMWQNTLGISVKAAPTDFNKLLTEITSSTNNAHGLQFWAIAWIADYPDPQDWTTLQFCSGCQNNNMNYGQNSTSDASTQQQVQQSLVAADALTNGAARYQQYNNAEQQLINDVAWLPMEQVTYQEVIKPAIHGVTLNAQGLIPPNDWGSIYVTIH